MAVINLKRSFKKAFKNHAMKPGWMFLNDVVGDGDTTPVLLSDPKNTLHALITADSTQKSFLELPAHVPAE